MKAKAIPQQASRLKWTVDYETLTAVATTDVGPIYIYCYTGVAELEFPWSPRKHSVHDLVKQDTVPAEVTTQMLLLMRCAEQEYATQMHRSVSHFLLWEEHLKDGDNTVYKTKTPFGDIFIGYTAKDDEPLGDITSVVTPWGNGIAALYLGDGRRNAVFNYSTASIRKGNSQVASEPVDRKAAEPERVSLDTVLLRVEEIYAATIIAENIALSTGFKQVEGALQLAETLGTEAIFVETSFEEVGE